MHHPARNKIAAGHDQRKSGRTGNDVAVGRQRGQNWNWITARGNRIANGRLGMLRLEDAPDIFSTYALWRWLVICRFRRGRWAACRLRIARRCSAERQYQQGHRFQSRTCRDLYSHRFTRAERDRAHHNGRGRFSSLVSHCDFAGGRRSPTRGTVSGSRWRETYGLI